jgi:HAE1 family hydrophobic/amphiphilic exporter-1
MRRITQLFVNRPPLVFVLVAVIALAGGFALATLVQQQFPNIDFPTINVSVSYPGASPTELRDSVVRPIEDAIAGAPDLSYINTSIQQNQASISATFSLDSNQTTDLTEVQDRVQTASAALPSDLPAPSVRTFDPAQATVVTISVTSQSLSVAALSAIVTNNIVPAIEQVPGISYVGANGTVTQALEVLVDPEKLAGRSFTTTDVVTAIQSNNVRAPGGTVYSDNRETSLDIRGDVQTPASVANLLLTGSSSVLLGATSPSGTVTQKYSVLSGSTNQALALSNSNTTTSSAATSGNAAAAEASTETTLAAANAGGSGSSASTSQSSTGEMSSLPSGANQTGAATPTPSPLTANSGSTVTTSVVSSSVSSAGNGSFTPQPTIPPLIYAPAAVAAGASTPAPSPAPAMSAFVPAANTTVAASVPASYSALTPVGAGSGVASSGLGSETTNPYSTSSQLTKIGDVATVVDSYEPKRVYSYVNGKQAITLNVQKATGASEVTSSEAVVAALPAIEAQYPDIAFHILNVQADDTKAQLFGVLQTLIEGIVFTGIAMLFFLRSWRNSLVVMVAIPTSLFVTFFAMKLGGFTIDTISLLAMTLIIGILVDDSIVVLENIERHFEGGEAPRTAAILGRSEIGGAAVVITLVDVVVFLPIAFLPGITGRFLAEFGIVVTIATLTSLIISFTITPSIAGNWSLLSNWRPPRLIEAFSDGFARLRNFYSERVLSTALRHPKTVAIASGVLTVGAISLIPLGLIGFEFIPSVDRGQIFVSVQFPTGTPLATTDAAVRALTNRFLEINDVQQIVSTSGTTQQGFGGSTNLGSNGQLRVFLNANRKNSTDAVARTMTGLGHRLVPGAKVVAIPATGTRGGNSQPLDFTVTNSRGEPDVYAQEILAALQDTPGAVNATSSAAQQSPQIDIQFDRDRARAMNLDIGLASQAVRAAFGGTLATQFDTVNGTKYVQVLYPLADDTSLDTLRSITLRNRAGQIVHLGDVAILQSTPSEALITRVNRQTVIHVSGNIMAGYALSNVQSDFMKRVAALHLPNTVHIGQNAGGTQQNLTQTVNGLGVSLILSFTLVYLLMVGLYNAYRAPLVIMFAVPVAAVGAFGALALTRQSLNLYSLIGTVMLIGLVSKNGILLVDFAHLKVLDGMDKLSAITQAARERFRPIIMTTASMISGMLPLALALDPGSTAKRSLGTVVIGGLTSSLLLTLVLVPVVYMWLAPGPPQRKTEAAPAHDGQAPALTLEPR